MATKMKISFMKVIPPSFYKKSILENIKNIHVSYRHNENSFIVQMTSGKPKQSGDSSCNSLIRGENTELLQFNVEKHYFIKNIVDNILLNEPPPVLKSKRVVIDFSSPNIAKPFHAGHLRSTIIGNFIANINKYFNNHVTKINYLGDWGTQFGLLQYGLLTNNIQMDDLKCEPIKKLYDVYVQANTLSKNDAKVQEEARKYFADIEQGKTDLENWKLIREITVKELEKVYNRLGITFDAYHWESDYNGGAIKELLTLLDSQNIIRTDESGKKVAKLKDKDITILKSDNSTLYLSRDVAALLDRYERYKFDKMLYVVDSAQRDHFAAVFNIAGQVNRECINGCEHIQFGRIKGMSTRTGNVVFLNDILDEAKEKMHQKQQLSKNTRNSAMNDKTTDILGISAVIINDLKQRRQRDYEFNWDRTLQSEGDSGIKLQYLHCRLCSLEQNCNVTLPNYCDPDYLTEEVIGEVIAELGKFDSILHRTYLDNEASILVNYLFKLAKHVNRMFNELRVKDVDHNLASQRLLVFHSARLVLNRSLQMLGLEPLYEM